jgi:8-oxo-dGTP diphosphatase
LEKERDYIGVGVGAIVVDRGRVWLSKRRKELEPGCWGIQGGAVEFGESIEDAVKRELKEELSVEVELVALLSVTDHILPHAGVH